jgi:hypothetical protein
VGAVGFEEIDSCNKVLCDRNVGIYDIELIVFFFGQSTSNSIIEQPIDLIIKISLLF